MKNKKIIPGAMFYVYTHSVDGIIFYVGSSKMRTHNGGDFRTWHERAYLTTMREPEWKAFVCGRKFEVEFVGYYNSAREAFDAEYQTIYSLINQPNVSLVNKLGTRPINQFNLNGILLRVWPTIAEASRVLGIDPASISCCALQLNKNRTSAGGYLWSYKKKVSAPLLQCIIQKNNKGEVVETYPTLKDASRAMNTSSSTSIRGCLIGRQKTAYGFIWERTEGKLLYANSRLATTKK